MQIVPCFWEVGPWCAGWVVEKFAFPLGIASVVYWFALHQIEKTRRANLTQLGRKRQIDFADKQLAEFYAPMMGARTEILNHTIFDQHLTDASEFVDVLLLRQRQQDWDRRGTPEYAERAEARSEQVKVFVDGNNKRFDKRVDAYISMRELFAKKMAYADPDTREWYAYFYAFVEMRLVCRENETSQFMTNEVQGALGSMFAERLLQPFYAHLAERVDYLQREIQGEMVEKKPAPASPEVGRPKDFLGRSDPEE